MVTEEHDAPNRSGNGLKGAFAVTVFWLGGTSFAQAPGATPQPDFLTELWTMVKVAGPIASVIIYWLWTRDQKRWDEERVEYKAAIKKLQDEKDAMQERTLTTLRDSRDATVMVAEKLSEQSDLLPSFFEVVKAAIQERKR